MDFNRRDKVSKSKIKSILNRGSLVSKGIFLFILPFVVAVSLWTTILMCILVLFVVVTDNRSTIIGFIFTDQRFIGFSYFPLSYLVFFIIIWFSKDLWKYGEKLYSAQVQQLYFLVSIVTALVFLSIDRVWS